MSVQLVISRIMIHTNFRLRPQTLRSTPWEEHGSITPHLSELPKTLCVGHPVYKRCVRSNISIHINIALTHHPYVADNWPWRSRDRLEWHPSWEETTPSPPAAPSTAGEPRAKAESLEAKGTKGKGGWPRDHTCQSWGTKSLHDFFRFVWFDWWITK